MATHYDNLYHYTSYAAKVSIFEDKVIYSSNRVKYGPGVYFTSLRPRNPDMKLLRNNWDGEIDLNDEAVVEEWMERLQWVYVLKWEDLKDNGYNIRRIKDHSNRADIVKVWKEDQDGINLREVCFNVNPRHFRQRSYTTR